LSAHFVTQGTADSHPPSPNTKKTYPADKFNLHYTPFYLNPAEQVKDPNASPFPIPSVPRREHITKKFGAERAQQIERAIHQLFADEGIPLDFGGRIGPSRNGHRLVYWAQSVGGEHAQNDVMLAL
jgi:predicted DsbA family dithiol-disulfide isomerase